MRLEFCLYSRWQFAQQRVEVLHLSAKGKMDIWLVTYRICLIGYGTVKKHTLRDYTWIDPLLDVG